ncbi:hypothetical protein VNO80_18233 [Phaseolus coccineus]|uniref:Uncharacterized protein n=1 Tax=Phaseolus coccineus TaxID=3886 RepID=A0AAN9QZA3_PHACN
MQGRLDQFAGSKSVPSAVYSKEENQNAERVEKEVTSADLGAAVLESWSRGTAGNWNWSSVPLGSRIQLSQSCVGSAKSHSLFKRLMGYEFCCIKAAVLTYK